MKRTHFGLITLGLITFVSAYSHPGDDKPMKVIDAGSRLAFLKDVNIPSDGKLLAQDGKLYSYFSDIDLTRPYCNFSAYKVESRWEESRLPDSVIRKGKVLTISYVGGTAWFDGTVGLTVATSSPEKIVFIACARAYDDAIKGAYGTPTIGEFRSIMNGILQLNLKDPLDL